MEEQLVVDKQRLKEEHLINQNLFHVSSVLIEMVKLQQQKVLPSFSEAFSPV